MGISLGHDGDMMGKSSTEWATMIWHDMAMKTL